MTNLLTVSLSAVQSFQKCEQMYWYRYVERLRRKDRSPAPELGSILHDYLGNYYEELKGGAKPEDAHVTAQLIISTKYLPDSQRYANVAIAAGLEDLAKELLALPGLAGRITDRYFLHRGLTDAEEHEVLLTETSLSWNVTRRIVSNGRLDLVTRDRAMGRIWLWEHKSTGNIPPMSVRIRDLQTPLYNHKLAQRTAKVEIDGCIWNYLRTKEPTVPDLVYRGTKREGLTRRGDLDSTWETYLQEIENWGLNEADYEDMQERLSPREHTVFFPRFEQVIITDPEVVLGDYRQVAKNIDRKRKAWERGTQIPIRTLGRDCDYCEFNDLCMSMLINGDDTDVRRIRFRRAGEE